MGPSQLVPRPSVSSWIRRGKGSDSVGRTRKVLPSQTVEQGRVVPSMYPPAQHSQEPLSQQLLPTQGCQLMSDYGGHPATFGPEPCL